MVSMFKMSTHGRVLVRNSVRKVLYDQAHNARQDYVNEMAKIKESAAKMQALENRYPNQVQEWREYAQMPYKIEILLSRNSVRPERSTQPHQVGSALSKWKPFANNYEIKKEKAKERLRSMSKEDLVRLAQEQNKRIAKIIKQYHSSDEPDSGMEMVTDEDAVTELLDEEFGIQRTYEVGTKWWE